MIYFLFGLLTAFVYTYLILPKNCGTDPSIKMTIYPFFYNGMIIIPIDENNALHIHHWLIFSIICFSSIIFNIPTLLLGISLGLSIQGLFYNDCFDFICDNPYN